MEALVAELRDRTALVAAGGGEASVERHRSRGKLPARERIDRLVDPGTAFLELNALAGLGAVRRTGAVSGDRHRDRVVEGRECVVVANDATVKGGTYFPLTVKKHLRAQEVAEQNHLPCIYLVDSGGAFLPLQAEVFPDREHFGRIFFNQARMSAQGDPADRGRDGLLHGRRRLRPGDVGRDDHRPRHGDDLHRRPAAREGGDRRGGDGGGARRRGRAHAPVRRRRPLRDLGRARARARPPGRGAPRRPAAVPVGASPRRSDPVVDPAELYGLVPEDFRHELDPLEVIARIVDGSRFHEFKALYGDTLVCGFARIEGHPVGILANRGILFAESSQKGAHFIELACKRRIPLVFLQNITGFMVGREYEAGRDRPRRREARDGGRLRRRAEVHRRHGRLVRRRELRDVRAGVRAASALDVAERADQRDGRRSGGDGADHGRGRGSRRDPRDVRARGIPYYSTARLWDDGIIDPRDTRRVLALGLSAAANAPVPETTFGVFRM